MLESPYKKIIVDLRENYGGLTKYAVKYLYPALYDENVEFIYRWKTPDTEQNKKMTGRLGVKLAYYDEKKQNAYYYKAVINYKGQQKNKKDVYYLVGAGTGSAADGYIAMIKENKLGTIVGTNTGGEGLGASFICDSLSNSSLVYIYYPSIPIDNEEKNNYSCGIEPDVYVTQTRNDYDLQQDFYKQGNVNEYDAQLEYDTVFKWAVEQ